MKTLIFTLTQKYSSLKYFQTCMNVFKDDILKNVFFPTMEVNGALKQPGYRLSSKYLPLCSAEQTNN